MDKKRRILYAVLLFLLPLWFFLCETVLILPAVAVIVGGVLLAAGMFAAVKMTWPDKLRTAMFLIILLIMYINMISRQIDLPEFILILSIIASIIGILIAVILMIRDAKRKKEKQDIQNP